MDNTRSPAGYGVRLPVPDFVTTDALFSVLKDKVTHPGKYLPATDVTWQDGNDSDGTPFVFREMTLMGHRIAEKVYVDHSALRVRYVDVGKGGGTVEVINAIEATGKGGRHLAFWQQQESGERMHWDVSKEVVQKGIQACIDAASSMSA